MDEAIRVNHPLTYDQEFLIFIFASQREREEGPPDPILRPIHSAKKKKWQPRSEQTKFNKQK